MVEKEQFSAMVKNPLVLNPDIIPLLEQTIKAFPYCQITYSLLARASKLNGTIDTNNSKSRAAAYALSRTALQQLVENDHERLDQSEALPEIDSEELAFQNPANHDFLSINEPVEEKNIANLHSEEQKRQQQIIQGFMKKNPRIQRQENAIEPIQIDLKGRLAESGTSMIDTEAYANILFKQGKIDKAKDVYQKLILKNPKKRNYFAKKLGELNASN